MRWIAVSVVLVLAFLSVVGCKQQCYMTECDYGHYRSLGLPPNAEYSQPPITPAFADVKRPADVNDPDRPIRYITLNEAIAMALEHGNVGSQSFQGISGGFVFADSSISFTGRGITGSDAIRVLALDPAAAAA